MLLDAQKQPKFARSIFKGIILHTTRHDAKKGKRKGQAQMLIQVKI